MRGVGVVMILVGVVGAACGSGSSSEPAAEAAAPTPTAATAPEPEATSMPADEPGDDLGQEFPDVIAASASRSSGQMLRFDVTISSPYDTADRYADAWRVVGPDGTVYGTRELLHDHAGEQPFTRSLDGVEIPAGLEVVTIEARDQANGWGGQTVDVAVPPTG